MGRKEKSRSTRDKHRRKRGVSSKDLHHFKSGSYQKGPGASSAKVPGTISLAYGRWLLLILAMAFLLRISFLIEVHNSIFSTPHLFDQANYIKWAEGIIKGHWEGMNDPYWQGPLYPYIVAILFAIFNKSILVIRLMQLLTGLGMVAGVFFLTRMLFDDLTALIASFIAATFRTFIFLESAILSETLLAFCNLVAIVAILSAWKKRKRIRWLLAGVLVGMATIGRGTSLLLIPLVIIWHFFADKKPLAKERQPLSKRPYPSQDKRKDIQKRKEIQKGSLWIPLIAFMIGAIIAIAPVTIRNKVVSKEFVLLSTNLGLNLFIGNHQGANGTYDLVPGLDTQVDPHGKTYAEGYLKRTLSPSELSKFYSNKAKEFAVQQPASFARILGKKLLLFCHSAEISHDDDFEYFRRKSFIMKLPLFSYGLLFPLTIIGVFCGLREESRRYEKILVSAALLVFMMVTILFFVALRYRIPTIPLMLPFAAFALVKLWMFFKRQQWRLLIPSFIFLSLLFLIVHLPYQPIKELVLLSKLQSHNQTSLVLQQLGQIQKAIEELQAAIRLSPENSSLHLNLGNALLKLGDSLQAEKEYREAIRLNPGNINAHNNLGLMLEERGDLDGAEKEYLQALSINPNHPLARRNLQSLRYRRIRQSLKSP